MTRADGGTSPGMAGSRRRATAPRKLTAWIVGVGACTLLAGAALAVSAAVGRSASPFGVATGASTAASTAAPPLTTAAAPSTAPEGTAGAVVVEPAPLPGASTTGTATPASPSSPAPAASPHFDTPQAAMVYLTAAYNRGDRVALGHVTTPAARDALDAMHAAAVNLRLDHCDQRREGDYLCYFHHDYRPDLASPVPGDGQAVFLVGPAADPGWYMTVLESCN